jgi:FMN phosphatase YigB (HAD superfamily)
MIKALIFDLDNCVAASKEVGEDLLEPAFDAIRQANRGQVSGDDLQKAFTDMWRYALDWVAERYGFSNEMRDAGWRVFENLEVTHPMFGYGDLNVLGTLPVQRFLVTSGFRRLQESKFKALKLAPLFNAMYVDAIDEPNRLGKQEMFQQILAEHQLTPDQVLVIGDNADSEIAAGNRLGIRTVQTLRPEVPPTASATWQIHSFVELKEILEKLAATQPLAAR